MQSKGFVKARQLTPTWGLGWQVPGLDPLAIPIVDKPRCGAPTHSGQVVLGVKDQAPVHDVPYHAWSVS